MLCRDFRLDAAPRSAVSRDHDLAFHIDASTLELFVIRGNAVVDVNEVAGDVTVNGVGVVHRQLFAGLPRCRILRNRRLEQLCRVLLRRDQLNQPFFRRGKEDLEFFDVGVIAPRPEERCDELRILAIVIGSEVMRTGGETLHPVAKIIAIHLRIELRFERVLLRRIRRCEAEDGFVVRLLGERACGE